MSLAEPVTFCFSCPRKRRSLPAAGGDDFANVLSLCDVFAEGAGIERRRRAAACMSEPERVGALIQFAAQEQVLPAFAELAASRYAGLVPKAHRAVFAVEHARNRERNALVRRAVLELGDRAAAAGLTFAVLKGVAWVIEDEAGNASWRSMIDLDLLVDPHQFDSVPALLASLGYVRTSQARRFRNNFHHAPYGHAGLPFTIEVHRHLGWRHELLAPALVLANATPVEAGLLLPAPWCRAFHAMIHWQIQDYGHSRATLPLRSVIEVARFLRRPDVDWSALRAHAQSVDCEAACEAATAIAAKLLDAPAPPEFALTPRAARHVERALARNASPLRVWLATELWRAGTLWHCEKVRYRVALRGMPATVVAMAVWASRLGQLPLLAVRMVTIGIRASVLLWRGK